ncbi:MAG: hypothetical protein N3D20_01620 [Candidatus Pacearchaeota archaeon]|nr:hypothetical protein [Candidatus Pacearchaeota archaeon]
MKKSVLFAIIFVMGFVFFMALFSSNIKQVIPLTGKTTSTAVVGFFVSGEIQERNVSKGWNFVSFYVEAGNYSVENVLNSIEGYYDYVLEWDSNNQKFKTWSKFGTREFNELNKNKSYFIFLNSAGKKIILDGEKFGNLTLILRDGWEAPDYIYEYESENITENTFKNVTFEYIQKWNETKQEFMVYSKLRNEQPFNKIYPGEGYLILTKGGYLVYVRTQG